MFPFKTVVISAVTLQSPKSGVKYKTSHVSDAAASDVCVCVYER